MKARSALRRSTSPPMHAPNRQPASINCGQGGSDKDLAAGEKQEADENEDGEGHTPSSKSSQGSKVVYLNHF